MIEQFGLLMPVEPAHSANCCVREAAMTLIRLLREDFSRRDLRGKSVAISFSGGLDSTLLAKVSLEFAQACGIVAGTPDSIDIKNARASAKQVGMELREVTIDEDDVVAGAQEICRVTGLIDPLTISFELPVYLAMKSAEERMVVTGQGADELFGGYAKYEKLSPDEFARVRAVDLDKALGPTRQIEKRIASSLRKEIVKPFLSNSLISFAMALPIDVVHPSGERKPVIRRALIELGLGDASRLDKKAAQYGSGVMNLLRKAATRRNQTIGELVTGLAKEVR